jgi:hypothetical protein
LISTGIGAIIVGLGLLIANFDKVTEAVQTAAKWIMGIKEKFDKLGAGVKIAIAVIFPFIGIVWGIIEALEYFGVVDDAATMRLKENNAKKIKAIESERDAFIKAKRDEIKSLDERYASESAAMEHQLALAQANGKDTVKLERALLEEKKRVTAEKIALLEQLVKKEFESNLAIFRIQAQTNDLVKGLLSNIEKQIKDSGGQEAFIKNLIGSNDEINELKKTLDSTEKELEIFEAKVSKSRRDAQKKEIEEAQAHEDELQRIQGKRAESIIQANKEVETSSANLYMMLGQMQDEANKKQEKLDKEALDRKLANIDKVGEVSKGGFEFLSNLSSIFSKNSEKEAKREFQINKAKDLAGAVTNTAKGVTQALASAPPPLGFIRAAAVGALGASNIGRILSTQFGGSATGAMSSSVSAGSQATVTPQSANTNDINNTSTNVNSLLNGGQSVLVVDSFTKVAAQQDKVQAVGTIG